MAPWRSKGIPHDFAGALALTDFISRALLLPVLMEGIRSQLALRGKLRANGFTPDNAGLSPLMQRLARAHANCTEPPRRWREAQRSQARWRRIARSLLRCGGKAR
jgi:hypothetical protein